MNRVKNLLIVFLIIVSADASLAADVVIITDQGGHESAAAQVQHLMEQAGVSFVVVYQGKFKKEAFEGEAHERHLKRFEETPELINENRDRYYERAAKTATLAELSEGYDLYLDKITGILAAERPRVVILTSPLLELFGKLKRLGITRNLPIGWIPTDYGRQDLWTRLYASAADMIFSPASQWTAAAISRGTPKEKIITTGMPVHPNAIKPPTPSQVEEMWKPLGFSRQIPTILIAGGSAGLGGYKPVLDSIKAAFKDQKVQIIAATGAHKRNFDLVTEYSRTAPDNIKIVPLGFTDKLPQYMRDIADIIVTKAGGLTSTEVALIGKPMVHTIPAVNVERDNVLHFSEEGMAITSTWADMGGTLLRLINSKERQDSIVRNQRRVMGGYDLSPIVEWTKSMIDLQKESGIDPSVLGPSDAVSPDFCDKVLGEIPGSRDR